MGHCSPRYVDSVNIKGSQMQFQIDPPSEVSPRWQTRQGLWFSPGQGFVLMLAAVANTWT